MALIGKIRRNSWLLVVMLGLGLGGFIIMDMTSSGGRGGQTDFTIGKVNKEKIDWMDLQRAERALYGNSDVELYDRRSYLWNYFIEEALVKEEAQTIGLDVGADELQELLFGVNLSPVVERNFTDPATNQVNRQSLNEFKQALDAGTLAPEYQTFWEYQTQEVIKERLQAKLIAMVDKGIYTPTWMAEQHQQNIEGKTDFHYIMIPYDQIDDSEVELTDTDYKAYLNDHKELYKNSEEMRVAKYVVFDVIPTSTDSMIILESITELKEPFMNAEDDSTFVEYNYGSMEPIYYKKEDLSPAITDTAFDLAIEEVYGPYIDEGAYKLMKVIDKKLIPDSVRSRHILLQARTQDQALQAQSLADSLKVMLETGVQSFDSLAAQYSQDPGSAAQGGDLGFSALGRMVKPFNDMIFYQAEPGEINIVYTQFGIHLVEVTDRRFTTNTEGIKLAFVSEAIVPSEATQDRLYDEALDYISDYRSLEALTAQVEERDDLLMETAPLVMKNGFNFGTLGPGNTSRDIIRWLFESGTKTGNVAPAVYIYEDEVNYFNSKYVLVALDKVIPKGMPSVDDIREEIEGPVKNRKKGELIVSRIESNDLQTLASQFNMDIDSVENMNFGMSMLRNIGDEPKVIGIASKLDEGAVSEPIIGINGVYVLKITNKVFPPLPKDIAQLRNQVSRPMKNAVQFQLVEAMRESADIVDNRYTYY